MTPDVIIPAIFIGAMYLLVWLLLVSLIKDNGESQWWPRWKKIVVWAGLIVWPLWLVCFIVLLIGAAIYYLVSDVLLWPFK